MSSPEIGHNAPLLTRDEFLRQVLYSGQLTQIAQHIALVVFLVAEGKNQLGMSLRELQKITGWDRRAIKDHLSELEVFMRVTLGVGRVKAIWELQGVIEDALAASVVNGARGVPFKRETVPQPSISEMVPDVPVSEEMAPNDDHSSEMVHQDPIPETVHQPAISGPMVHHVPANSLVVHQVAASLMATVGTISPVMAHQPPISPPAAAEMVHQERQTTFPRERDSKITIDIPSLSHATPREAEDDVQVNGVAITWDGRKVTYKEIDLAAGLIGMPKDLARSIAELCVRGWVSSGEQPRYPMAKIKNAMMEHHNRVQVHGVRLDKSKAEGRPSPADARQKVRELFRKREGS